jgi:signal transduction histidine kinase
MLRTAADNDRAREARKTADAGHASGIEQSEENETRLRDQLALAGRVSLVGELAASIVHEVNQPLCAIVSNAQTTQRLLAGEDFDLAEVREALEDIVRDGQRASAVIARIRGLLRKTPPERAAINVNELIREVIALTRWEMNRRGIAVRLELAEHLPGVLGDRVQLQQVFLNLMTNGADAMESMAKDKRELVLRSAEEPAEGVRVSVKDHGVGIDPRNSERLFDSFFTTKPGGMGMGLAICKSIVEAHGGRIWASPNGDGGSTFQLALPRIRESTS